MRYLTDRKRAEGKGAAHAGGTATHHYMQLSAVGLAFMVPTFLYIFGHTLGQGHEVVIATFSRPFPAILTGLVIFIAMRHFSKGAKSVVDDYTKGTAHKTLSILILFISYTVTAIGLYALARIVAL